MRIFQLLLLTLLLSGCIGHHSASDFDIASIEKSAIELLDLYPSDSNVNIEQLPVSLSKLKPYNVRIDKAGIYIKLDEEFVSASGLFIARNGYIPNLSKGVDPSYKLLKNNTYSFVIKG